MELVVWCAGYCTEMEKNHIYAVKTNWDINKLNSTRVIETGNFIIYVAK